MIKTSKNVKKENVTIATNKLLLLLAAICALIFFIDMSVIITCPVNQELTSNIKIPIEGFPTWFFNSRFWIINFENITYSAIMLLSVILFINLYFGGKIIESILHYMGIVGIFLCLNSLFSTFILPGLKYGNLGVIPGNRFNFTLHYDFNIQTMTFGILGVFLILSSKANKKIKDELESFV